MTGGRDLLLYSLALAMESTNRVLFGKTRGKYQSCSPLVIDPRLLSLDNGLPQAKRPSSAALFAAGAVWNQGSKQSDFQKHLRDETDVRRRISQHTKLDSLQPSVATNNVSTTSIDRFAPTVVYSSTTNTDSLMHNDFDAAFLQLEPRSDTESFDANAISYLSLWVAKNKSIHPPVKQLNALETLTEVPAWRLLAWLTRHGKALLAEQKLALTRAKVPFVPEELYFVRCLKSGFRFRPRKSDSDEPKVFECTNQCGQLFCRKGDWGRHERLNFEEWPCPHCGKVLSRCEHLRAHFKDAHPVEKDISKYQKREFLTARQRPCGFCGSTLTDWSAWLGHVASHFEEHREGGTRAMSNWTEHRFLGEVGAETVVTAPEEAMLGTMTAWETQLDHVTSSALWREAETLYEQNEEDEKSARQDKDEGRDRDPHGRVGNHYNESEPQFRIRPKSSTKVQTGNRNGGAPSFEDDISYNPTYGSAGRHMPERQASGEPASSSYSGSRHRVAGARHPIAERQYKAKFAAGDSFGYRNSSDEDCDHLIGHFTKPAAVSRHQRTAHVSPRHGSSRHSRPPSPPMPAALSRHQSTAYVSPRHNMERCRIERTPPLRAVEAERGVESEDPYDELESAYGAMRIRDA